MDLPEARLKEMTNRFEEVERALADPEVAARPDELRALGKEHAELKPTVEAWRGYRRARDDFAEARAMLAGSKGEEREYLESEIASQQNVIAALEEQIAEALIPKDPND